jgi:hypothetical protein
MKRRSLLQLATALYATGTNAFAAPPAKSSDAELRHRFWSGHGPVIDRLSLDPLSPFHTRHPAFPGGMRNFQLIDRGATRLVTTDGLSDAVAGDERFADRNGFELELYIETDEALTTLENTWTGGVLLELATLAINHGRLANTVERERYVTVQLKMDGVPEEWSLAHEDGNVGMFLGLEQTSMPGRVVLSKTHFAPVSAKLMRPAELQYAIDGKSRARADLAARYARQTGKGQLSNIARASVV